MNDSLENITFEELQNPDNKITPAMLFPDKAGKDEAVHVSDSDKKSPGRSRADDLTQKMMNDTCQVKKLFKLLESSTTPKTDLKSLLDKSPMDLFIAEHTVGKPFSSEMFEAGQKYISENLSIIPVGRDKKPLIPWKIYQEKRATIEELLEWFQKFPDMQLAVVTGKISGIICVDVDDPKIDISWLPTTALVRTGSGGWHYWYSYVEGFGNRIRIKESIDLKSDSGYVIVPPSSNLKGKYEWIKKIPLARFPNNLFFKEEIIIRESVKTEYVGFGEGQRNSEMVKYIGHIVAKIHPSEWDSIAYPVIQEANNTNRPPLSEWELKTIYESICNRERRNNSERWYKQQETKSQPIKLFDDINDEVLTMAEAVKRQPIDYGETYSSGIEIIDKGLVGGFNSGNLVVISSPTGMGKTSLCQTLTYSFTLQGLSCIWFSYEVLIQELWQKFKDMGMDEKYLCYTPLYMTSGSVDWIEKKIKEAKIKFNVKAIFIDHLGFLMPKIKEGEILDKTGNNYSLHLTRICRDLKTLALRENIMIFIPAHMRKTDDPNINSIAYAAGISQEADVVLVMDREINNESDENIDDYYTGYTKITLMKVRKPNGRNLKGWFRMENGKLIHDSSYFPKIKVKKWSYKKKQDFFGMND